MRIGIVANDTRGGVQPYAALGVGLQAAGHEVRMVAPSDFAALMAAEGLQLAPLSGSIQADLRGASQATSRGPIAALRFIGRELAPRVRTWTRETLEACDGVDVVTGGVAGMIVGLSVAERLGVPFVPTYLQPVDAPTDAYPGVLLSRTPTWLGSWGRRLSHTASDAALWAAFRRPMASARTEVLGLSGRATAADGQPVLYGFSRHVLQVPPRDPTARHVTGYWRLVTAPEWRPPPALEEFVARGGPVVSVGFGSMPDDHAERVTDLVLAAARDAGVRVVLLSGWGGLAALPLSDDAVAVDEVPHDWLFPRVAAAVHHGGAGTTGAALRAGIPAVVVPFTADQPFWAARVADLGAGPAPIPRKRLTADRLADALRRAVTDGPMRARAVDLGARITAEDGVAEAVGHFECLPSARSSA